MKYFLVLATALLSLAVNATPVPEASTDIHEGREGIPTDDVADRLALISAISARDAAAESVDLLKRTPRTCKIVNVVTVVDCHYWPTHASTWKGLPNRVVTSFKGSTKLDFNCYMNGQTVGGIPAWDFADGWNCFVPGYYTDAGCTHQALGKCPF